MSQRLFTLEEANALIPRLELIMERLQRHGVVVREKMSELAHITGQDLEHLTSAQVLELRPRLVPLVEEVKALLAEIEACGGQLKGLDLGLVDFPAERDGEIVLLCWQYGEKEIAYYHSFDAGFAGRQPLDPSKDRLPHLQ